MAKSGDVIGNPVTGELVTFEQTASETGGELLSFHIEFTPRGFLAQNHLHPKQSELHEVIAGSVGIHADGHQRVLGPGDPLLVPAGKPHRLVAHDPCEMRQEVRPAPARLPPAHGRDRAEHGRAVSHRGARSRATSRGAGSGR
jgi:mannose-6-phosphate isomerase-like protein (cupin superfamily)